MVQAVDHDPISGAATVTGEAAKGGLGGILLAGLVGVAGALLVGVLLTSLPLIGAITPALWLPVSLIAGVGTGVAWGATGGVLGGLFGAAEGVVKVNKQQHAFDAQMREHQANIAMAQAMAQPQMLAQAPQAVAPQPDPQEIYNQGVQAGAEQVLNRLQEVHSQMVAQEQQSQAAQAAPVAPAASEPQQFVHHHVIHAPNMDANLDVVHASEETGEAKRSFTALSGGIQQKSIKPEDIAQGTRKISPQDIIAAREAANDPNFSQQRLA